MKEQDFPIDQAEEKKAKIQEAHIKTIRNFPQLPEIQKLKGANQYEILSKYFPWGCSKLTSQYNNFSCNDKYKTICYASYVDICIGLKYGICHAKQNEFVLIHNLFFELAPGASLYLKLCEREKKFVAIGQVTAIKPDQTFRFWHLQKNDYSVGVIMLNYISFGQVDERKQGFCEKYADLSEKLSQSPVEYRFLKASEDYEWESRRHYISLIRKGKVSDYETDIKEKNRELLERVKKGQKNGSDF